MSIGTLRSSDIPGYSLESKPSAYLKKSDTYNIKKSPKNNPSLKNIEAQVANAVSQLKIRDREVRSHEGAHLSAAGGVARGGATFVYAKGPDGKLYAIGGEVGIDSSPVSGDPEATIEKASKIRRAALAPANPSPQDRRVAAAASRMEQAARMEQMLKKRKEAEEEPVKFQIEKALEQYKTPKKEEENRLSLMV